MLVLAIWAIVAVSVFMSLFWYNVLAKHDLDVTDYPEPDRLPSISVLLPAYNEEETLADAIDSVLDQDYPDEKVHPIVIDDGSTDATHSIAQEYAGDGDIELIRQENQGKGAALNAGLEQADGELVAVQDTDSVLAEDAYRKMVGHFADPDVGAVIAGIKPLECSSLLQQLQRVEYLLGIVYRRLMAAIDTLYVTPGALSLYRRELIEEVGGFDEDTLTEDLEIAMRLRQHGYSARMSATAITFTEFPARFMELLRQRVRWYRGLISNTIRYRDMMYRDSLFGRFQMPINLLMPMVGLGAALLVVWGVGNAILDLLVHISAVGFEFTLFPDRFSLYRMVLGLDLRLYFPLGVALLLSGGLVYIAHQVTDEDVRNPLSLAAFFICYATILALFWSIALYRELRGRDLTW